MKDEDAVWACVGGDREAFRRLVDKYGERVYRFCRRRVPDDDAGDLAQETFVTAYATLSRLRDPVGFSGWLFGIARNKCRMHLRRVSRMEVPSDGIPDKPSSQADPEERIRQESLSRLVAEMLDRLTPDQREVVELFYWDGLTYDEISRALDLPKSTVKSRLHEARRSLKNMLGRSVRGRYRTQGLPVRFADEVLSRCGEGCECGLMLNEEGGV